LVIPDVWILLDLLLGLLLLLFYLFRVEGAWLVSWLGAGIQAKQIPRHIWLAS
jgi:hypothetical protein